MLTAPRRPRRTAPVAPNLHDPALYINRELSMLAFQRRVLEEAQDESNPLLERVKFLSIVGSNLNEFFMVRVAGLLTQLESGVQETGPDALTPAQQIEAIRAEFEQLLLDAHECLKQVLAKLAEHGIRVAEFSDLNVEERAAARQYFEDTIYPVLTPLAFDPGRPFPHISNLSLNLSVLIRDPEGVERFARIKVPDGMPQLVPLRKNLRGRTGPLTLVWIEQVIEAHLDSLFPGMRILEAHPFHVTRDAEMEIQELEAADLLEEVEEGVRQRRFGAVVRLKVSTAMPEAVLDILKSNLEIDDTEVYRVHGPLALNRLRDLYALDRPELKDPPFTPRIPKQLQGEEDIFAVIRRGDVLLHHPFDSFQPVVDFLRAAARDPLHGDDMGRCILALTTEDERRTITETWAALSGAWANYCTRILNRPLGPQAAAIAMLPERMQADTSLRVDIRTSDERDAAAKRAWLHWHARMAALPTPMHGWALRGALYGFMGDEALWLDRAPTASGRLAVAALRMLT